MAFGSRKKGKDGENEVARRLREVYPKTKRAFLSQARDGAESHDLEGTPWGIEVKFHRRVNIQKALLQAEAACTRSGKPPLVVTKDNRRPILVTMYLDDFIRLLRLAEGIPERVAPVEDDECSVPRISAEGSTPA
jgi:hypothetical protein